MRRAAENKLKNKEVVIPENIDHMSQEDIRSMIHELKVHQIQLEMQNEELKTIQEELDVSRSKYFDLYDMAPVGYLTLDPQGVIVEANLTASKLLGTDRSELLDTPFTRFIMREDQDIFYQHQKRLRKIHKHDECELRLLFPGEPPFWTLLSTIPEEDESEGLYFRMVISDITPRKQAEFKMVEAKKKAVEANEAKSQFLANMSHEIRTPLNGLMGMAHLLTMTELNEEQQEFVEHIKTSSDSLLSVIGDILDYSKIEAGEMQFESIPFEPQAVLEEVVKMFEVSASQKGLVIESKVDQDIPFLVGDPHRFRQVLTNLISNAVIYTAEGKIGIVLNKMKLSDSNKIKLKCSVQDTGIGIYPDKIHAMFDRFSQADTSNTREYGGTGLGLAICKGLVEKMNGEIWAESTLGKGSRFTFTSIMELADELEEKSTERMEKTHQVQNRLNLLLVEDDLISRILVEEIGKLNGWNVMMATDGNEGLRVFKENSFDAVVMDIQLPEMDGFTATGKIREWEADRGTYTPIIGLTAYAIDGTREKCIDAEMDDFLPKPIKPKRLQELITKITENKNDQ